MTIQLLPAFYGDCTLISWNDDRQYNILVDGGPARTYPTTLQPLLNYLKQEAQFIDLLIITHIDHDHLGGIIKLFEDEEMDKSTIKEVWFNSGNRIAQFIGNNEEPQRDLPIVPSDSIQMSIKEGNTLERYLSRLNWIPKIIASPGVFHLHNASFQILSPGYKQLEKLNQKWQTEGTINVQMSGKKSDYDVPIEELAAKDFDHDTAVPNGSSISFLLKIGDASLLMLADAFPSVVEENIRALNYNEKNKLQIDAVKVAHHGSKFNNSPSLYNIIQSSKFLVSTDGSRDNLPHKEALSRILINSPGCTFFFNYPKPAEIFRPEEKNRYKFECVYKNQINI
jgi:hypothetical protein